MVQTLAETPKRSRLRLQRTPEEVQKQRRNPFGRGPPHRRISTFKDGPLERASFVSTRFPHGLLKLLETRDGTFGLCRSAGGSYVFVKKASPIREEVHKVGERHYDPSRIPDLRIAQARRHSTRGRVRRGSERDAAAYDGPLHCGPFDSLLLRTTTPRGSAGL